jgi:hypothetical protein
MVGWFDPHQRFGGPAVGTSFETKEFSMRSILALALAAAFSTGALAQSDKEHAAHHPEGASAPGASAAADAGAAAPAQMDMQMKSMQQMHEKMMAAKTPEARQARQALMSEHMKSMHGGMAMMRQMKTPSDKGAGPMTPEMMSKRMDMMEMMMQMMMDREAMKTPATK